MNKIFTCEKCFRNFNDRSNYMRHVKNTNCVKLSEKYKFQCEKCKKRFVQKKNLQSHLSSNVCNKYNLVKINSDMRKIDNNVHDIIDSTVNNTNTTNNDNSVTNNNNSTTNNITINNNQVIKQNFYIVPHGKEKFQKDIPDDIAIRFIKKRLSCMPDIIEYLHCNPKLPQNHNIYKSNMRDNKILVYDGKKWLYMMLDECLEDMVYRNSDLIIARYEELKKDGKLKETDVEGFKKFINKNGNHDMIDRVKEPIILILYNNKDLIKETRKKVEKKN